MKTTEISFIIILVLVAISGLLNAQIFVGVSANYGNPVSKSSSSKFVQQLPAVSGNLMLELRENLGSGFNLHIGANAGVLGFNLRIKTNDTISGKGVSSFLEYGTVYGSLKAEFSKQVMVYERPLMIGIGGGVTRYNAYYLTSQYQISMIDNNIEYLLFDGRMELRNQTSSIIRFFFQKNLTDRFTFELAYNHHFRPALTGQYELYHHSKFESGTVLVYQREVSLAVLVRLSRKNRY